MVNLKSECLVKVRGSTYAVLRSLIYRQVAKQSIQNFSIPLSLSTIYL